MQEKGRGCLRVEVCLFKWKKLYWRRWNLCFFGWILQGFPHSKQQQACVLVN